MLDQILKLLHPFMPFITEELWARLVEVGVERENLLCLSTWPVFEGLADADADEEIGWIVKLVSEVRSVRTEMNVPPGAKVPLALVGAGKATRARADHHEDTIKRLARIDTISFAKAPPKGSAQIVLGETTAALPLAGVIDMAVERVRLEREIEKARAEIRKVDAKLGNESFVAKAPPEVVEENRERKAEFEATDRQAAGRAQARRGGPLGLPPPHATRGQRGRGTPMPASAVALISSPSQRWRATEETMRLAGKTAIVVGAGQSPGEGMGNGRATALLFAREGAKVLAVDHRLESAQGDGRARRQGRRHLRALRGRRHQGSDPARPPSTRP